jgi:hypothetical protein
VGISVSRVGGDAQTKAMRQVAGQLRLDLAQYRELAAFAQFASDLDTQTRNQLERGSRLTELLKQDKYQPVSLAEQVAVIYAGTQGYLDKVPVARVREWEAGFVRFLKSERADVLSAIEKQKALDDPLFERLKAAVSTFNHQFGVEGFKDVPDSGSTPSSSGGERGEGRPKPAAAVKAPAPPAPAPAKEQPKVAKPHMAQSGAKDEDAEGRPSQLDQIRAAISDEPKPKKPREPKAK